MESLIAKAVSLCLLVVYLSYLIQAKRWIGLIRFYEQNPDRIMLLTLAILPFAAIVVIEHNIWQMNYKGIITFLGWAVLIKAIFYLIFPNTIQIVSKFNDETMMKIFPFISVVMLAFSLYLCIQAF